MSARELHPRGRLGGVDRTALALLALVLLGAVAVAAGAFLVGGLGWALIAGGLLAVLVGLRVDIL